MADLDPLAPAEAVEMYLDSRRDEVSEQTLQSHGYRLKAFVEWCDAESIDNMNDVRGRELHRFKVHRRDVDDLKSVTLQGQLSTLRKFVDFCASIEAVEPNLREKIILPTVGKAEGSDDRAIEPERAAQILEHLDRYQFASRSHVMFALSWRTAMRQGGLRAPDLDDVDLEERCVELRHRPELDTPLKNGVDGERDVGILEDLAELLDEYIEVNREPTTDEYGREPLFTTAQGRISRSSVRETFYRLTQPCFVGECPHDRDPGDCEATKWGHGSKCPSSLSSHPSRRGSITRHRLEDVPVEVVSERVNATPEVIERHYDNRTKRERMEQRRKYLEDRDS